MVTTLLALAVVAGAQQASVRVQGRRILPAWPRSLWEARNFQWREI